MSALLCLLHPHIIWPQDRPEFNRSPAAILCQSIKQVNCLYGNQLARLPVSADSAVITLSAHSFLMPRRFTVTAQTPITRDAKDQVRVSACARACRLMMNPSFRNSTPLTCHSATEVMLITKPNTITKLSFSALCVCVCVR